MQYIIAIDQSTQGTKALLFDETGTLTGRSDVAHRQIINEKGWVSHDAQEIYQNTILAVKDLVVQNGIPKNEIAGIGISNQRETSLIWDKATGTPLDYAVVWQCTRASGICDGISVADTAAVLKKTGIPLSPYYPAAKLAWLLENVPGAKEKARRGELCFGTIDTWLVYKLTGGASFKTDYSNASRTQLFNVFDLKWDEDVCAMFGIDPAMLAEVCDSNAHFGSTDFEGFLDQPVPIHGVIGDSHGALFGQGCVQPGMIKATYGTGSSVMMNTGEKPVIGSGGIVTSLAWGIDGKVNYVLEGNIIFTGGVISWLKNDLQLIQSAAETEQLAFSANPDDTTYLVPAFTGLGAPHWNNKAKAAIVGMTSVTRRAEIAKAALECIAYQINDVLDVMRRDSGIEIKELRVDGGPTKNAYLMQFQSDLSRIPVQTPEAEELSGIGAAYLAGIALQLFSKETVFDKMRYRKFAPTMEEETIRKKQEEWRRAIATVISNQF